MNRPFSSSLTSLTLAALLGLALFGFQPQPFNPGVVFEIETTYHEGSVPRVEVSQMMVEGEMLKMEVLPGADSEGSGADPEAEVGGRKDAVIFRGDRREMVVVDHQWQIYMIMDEAVVDSLSQQLEAIREMANQVEVPAEVMDRLPKVGRKRLASFMKQRAGASRDAGVGDVGVAAVERVVPTVEYRRTSERGTQAGYPVTKYEKLENGVVVEELWVTDWANVEGGDEAQAAFASLAAFIQEMMDAFAKLMGGEGGTFLNDAHNPLSSFQELDGLPVLSRSFDEEGELESESLLRSARRQRLDPADFEPPAGYKRMSMGPQ